MRHFRHASAQERVRAADPRVPVLPRTLTPAPPDVVAQPSEVRVDEELLGDGAQPGGLLGVPATPGLEVGPAERTASPLIDW